MTDTYQDPEFDPFDNMAVDHAVSSLDEDPQEAARAIELGTKTGANPSAVHADLESFESNVKAATTANLIRSNRHISDYINSHPLATAVSNGDLHNLDEWSEKMKKVPDKGPNREWYESAGGIASAFLYNWGVGWWNIGKSLIEVPKDITKFRPLTKDIEVAADQATRNPTAHTFSQLVGAINEGMLASFLPKVTGEKGQKSVNVGAEKLLGAVVSAPMNFFLVSPTMKTIADLINEGKGGAGDLTEQVAILGMMFLGLKGHGKSFSKAGETPPPGISPEVDAIRISRSKEGLDAFNDSVKAGQKAQTTQIAPDFAERFAEQHFENGNVYVNVDAVRRLYGDKPPAPDDGILGWVPDLAEQIASQAEVGGDIAIPRKLWSVKVDPEVAKVLHDDMKIRRDDVTANEAEAIKEQHQAEEDLRALEEESRPPTEEFDEEIPEWSGERPQPQTPVDISRRGFLKGAAATIASAKAKVPGLKEVNPFEAATPAIEEVFRKNVEYEIAKAWEWDEFIWSQDRQDVQRFARGGRAKRVIDEFKGWLETIKTARETDTASALTGPLSRLVENPKILEHAIQKLESGWVPTPEMIDQIRLDIEAEAKAQSAKAAKALEEKRRAEASEMEKKLLDEGVEPEQAADIGNLPWPEEYMKGDKIPEGLIEHGTKAIRDPFGDAVAGVRAAARLQPILPARGPMEMRLTAKYKSDVHGELPGELERGGPKGQGVTHDIDIYRDGKKIGDISITPLEDGKLLHVEYARRADGTPWGSGFASPLDLKDVGRELRMMFPDAKEIGGWRASGAREKAGVADKGDYVRRPLTDYAPHEIATGKQVPADWFHKKGEPSEPTLKLGKSEKVIATSDDLKKYETNTVGSLTIKEAFGQLKFDSDKNSLTEAIAKYLTKPLLDKVGHVKIHFIRDNEFELFSKHFGFYDANSHAIFMRESNLTDPVYLRYTVLHETIHAATVRGTFIDEKYNARVQEVLDFVKGEFNQRELDMSTYGLTNTREFLAEAMSNKDFQRQLLDIDLPPDMIKKFEGRGYLRSAWDLLINTIGDYLGTGPRGLTALEAAIRLTQEGTDRPFTIAERMQIVGWRRSLENAEAIARPSSAALRSLDELEKIRSFTTLEDRILEQAGDLAETVGRDVIRRAMSLHPEIFIKKEKSGTWMDDLAAKLDPDDARNYIKTYESMNAEQFASYYEYLYTQDPHRPTSAAGPKEPELPGLTPMTYRKAFEKPAALGLTKAWYDQYQRLIAKQQSELAKRRMEKFIAQETLRQTEEWKQNSDRIFGETVAELNERPDISLDAALRRGRITEDAPKVGRRFRLNSDLLSDEQKAVLEPNEYAKDGMNPDDAARLWDFTSADAMLERLAELRSTVKETYANTNAYVNALARERTAQRMQTEYGDLGWNILDEARDFATSETQLDIMHEEIVGLAMQAGMEFSLTKADMKQMALNAFNKHKMGDFSVGAYLKLAGKHGVEVEKALLKNDFKTAFKFKQVQTLATMMAQEATKVEKEKKAWDRNTKRMARRVVGGIDPAYTNAIHDVMFRTGATPKPRRTLEDLADAFRRDGLDPATPLKDFVEERRRMYREVAVPDWLQDPSFQKEFDNLSIDEFRDANNAIKSLIHAGRDEMTIIREGEKFDLLETIAEMKADTESIPQQTIENDRIEPKRSKAKAMFWSLINMESLMNRLDKGKVGGLFKELVTRMITEGMNTKDAMMKKYQKQLNAVGKIKDIDKLVDNQLFVDQRTGEPRVMRKRNVLGVVQYAGDLGALKKLLKGHNIEQADLWNFLRRNTTREDWDRAEKIGKIFDDLFDQAAQMQHNLSGVAPVKTPRGTFVDPHGVTRQSWHQPIRYDRDRPKSPKLVGRSALEDEGYYRATVPTGYLTERTGYSAEFDLSLDIVPIRMRQMIHDIAMRPAIIQASKFIYHPEFDYLVRRKLGRHAAEEMVPWLRDVANSPNYMSAGEHIQNQIIEFFRQNMIASLIGFNPGTVAKHATTALLNSMNQVGYRDFAREFTQLLRDDGTGRSNWTMAKDKSEEIQRRIRNFQELIEGHGAELKLRGGVGKFETLRELAMHAGAAPVAFGDLLSSIPTWLVRYKQARLAGATEGSAIYQADLAVRQTHGSSVLSNKPRVMREGGALQQTFASLYGFFSHMMQKQYELAWRTKDTMGMFNEGEYKAGLKQLPVITGLVVSYIILPAVIEEIVTPYTNSERDSWGMKAAKTLAFGISSSTIGLRDFIHSLINVRDPQAGVIGTMMKSAADTVKDIRDLNFLSNNPNRVGKSIQHAFTMFGLATGMTNKTEGTTAEFLYRWRKGLEHPKGFGDIVRGIRYGTARKRRR